MAEDEFDEEEDLDQIEGNAGMVYVRINVDNSIALLTKQFHRMDVTKSIVC